MRPPLTNTWSAFGQHTLRGGHLLWQPSKSTFYRSVHHCLWASPRADTSCGLGFRRKCRRRLSWRRATTKASRLVLDRTFWSTQETMQERMLSVFAGRTTTRKRWWKASDAWRKRSRRLPLRGDVASTFSHGRHVRTCFDTCRNRSGFPPRSVLRIGAILDAPSPMHACIFDLGSSTALGSDGFAAAVLAPSLPDRQSICVAAFDTIPRHERPGCAPVRQCSLPADDPFCSFSRLCSRVSPRSSSPHRSLGTGRLAPTYRSEGLRHGTSTLRSLRILCSTSRESERENQGSSSSRPTRTLSFGCRSLLGAETKTKLMIGVSRDTFYYESFGELSSGLQNETLR